MFPMSTPASACRAPSEDRCYFEVLPGCVDLWLGVPGGHSRLLSASQIFLESVWPHPVQAGRLRRRNNSTKHNGRRAVMSYQGKFVNLLGDLLEIPHVIDRVERIIQQIFGDDVLVSSPGHQQISRAARRTRSLFS
jgi:hypothetical protein